jgi:hypothetical protein
MFDAGRRKGKKVLIQRKIGLSESLPSTGTWRAEPVAGVATSRRVNPTTDAMMIDARARKQYV